MQIEDGSQYDGGCNHGREVVHGGDGEVDDGNDRVWKRYGARAMALSVRVSS